MCIKISTRKYAPYAAVPAPGAFCRTLLETVYNNTYNNMYNYAY